MSTTPSSYGTLTPTHQTPTKNKSKSTPSSRAMTRASTLNGDGDDEGDEDTISSRPLIGDETLVAGGSGFSRAGGMGKSGSAGLSGDGREGGNASTSLLEEEDGDDRPEWQRSKRQGKATSTSSVSNLANTIIGSGALAFPSAFASMGMLPGIISCAFSGLTAAFGLYLLSRCATQVGRPAHLSHPNSSNNPNIPTSSASLIESAHGTPVKGGHARSSATKMQKEDKGYTQAEASFNTVALLTFGQGWATRCFDLAIAIKCFGVSVSYLIIVKTLMPQVVLSLSHHLPGDNLPMDSIWLDGRLWLLLSMIIVGPLSFLRRLDSLRFTSQVALASVVYLIIVVVGWYFSGASTGRVRGKVELATFSTGTLSSFPVQVFAYTCAQNLFPVFNELKMNTQKRMNFVIGTSIGSAALTYELLGIIGYLTFGSTVGSNVIAMYPFTSTFIAVGQLGIVLLVALSYPLQCHPCRACLHTLTTGWSKPTHQVLAQDEEDADANDDAFDGQTVDGPKEADHVAQASKPMSSIKFTVMTCLIIFAGLIVAFIINELEVVLSFVGATGSTIISFILPGLFYFNLFREPGHKLRWWALALAIYGMFVMVFALSMNIWKLSTHRAVSH